MPNISQSIDTKSIVAAVGILSTATFGTLFAVERNTHRRELDTATKEVLSLKGEHIGELREREASLELLSDENKQTAEEIKALKAEVIRANERLTSSEKAVTEWREKFEAVTTEKNALARNVEGLSAEVGSLRANVRSIETAWTDKWNTLLGVLNSSKRHYSGGAAERDGEFNRRKAWLIEVVGIDEPRAHRYSKTSQDHDSTQRRPNEAIEHLFERMSSRGP